MRDCSGPRFHPERRESGREGEKREGREREGGRERNKRKRVIKRESINTHNTYVHIMITADCPAISCTISLNNLSVAKVHLATLDS